MTLDLLEADQPAAATDAYPWVPSGGPLQKRIEQILGQTMFVLWAKRERWLILYSRMGMALQQIARNARAIYGIDKAIQRVATIEHIVRDTPSAAELH